MQDTGPTTIVQFRHEVESCGSRSSSGIQVSDPEYGSLVVENLVIIVSKGGAKVPCLRKRKKDNHCAEINRQKIAGENPSSAKIMQTAGILSHVWLSVMALVKR